MKRFVMLDILRGVAALAVVAFHLGQVDLVPGLARHGYLAVDLFFVLSGFVIAHAYEGALRTRLSWGAFAVKRVIRLYPLAFLGTLLGLVVLLLKWHTFPGKVDALPRILAAGLVNGFGMPMLVGGEHSQHMLFPGNGPLWSLACEIFVNLLWAVFGFRLSNRALALIVAASGLALAFFAVHLGTLNAGFDVATFAVGYVRVSFGFPLGVLIHRFRDRVHFGSSRAAQLLMLTMLQLAFVAPFANDAGVCWDLGCVFLLFPMILALGIRQHVESGIGAHIGDLSYPIYVLHFPLLLLVSGLRQSYLRGWDTHVLVIACLVVIVIAGEAALRLYDEPVRRLLSGMTGRVSPFSGGSGPRRAAAERSLG